MGEGWTSGSCVVLLLLVMTGCAAPSDGYATALAASRRLGSDAVVNTEFTEQLSLTLQDADMTAAKQALRASGVTEMLGDVRLARVLAIVGIGRTMKADVNHPLRVHWASRGRSHREDASGVGEASGADRLSVHLRGSPSFGHGQARAQAGEQAGRQGRKGLRLVFFPRAGAALGIDAARNLANRPVS